ncbi:phage holin family protein [Flavihumibacter rivuli]|uniref:phage holin family protein n=1 Tax=Flavihumibacter rivuli TaxID=2838156 RepID=UPI001BDF6828|nr:phage holin family protein [Flavihumibacter rivuli]ULQ56511.1 phage holin family protein [Flavihumibacter rivuli]
MENEQQDYFSSLEGKFGEYLQNRLLLMKMQAAEKSSRLAGILVALLVLLLVGFFVLIFISIMAGYLFAELTGSLFYGFGIITAIYILLFILVLVFRKKYIEPLVTNTVIRVLFEKDEDEETQNNEQAG